jgi:hypothetical protein
VIVFASETYRRYSYQLGLVNNELQQS